MNILRQDTTLKPKLGVSSCWLRSQNWGRSQQAWIWLQWMFESLLLKPYWILLVYHILNSCTSVMTGSPFCQYESVSSCYYSIWCSLYLSDTNKINDRGLARQMRLQCLGMVVQGLKGQFWERTQQNISGSLRYKVNFFLLGLRWSNVFYKHCQSFANYAEVVC